MLVERVQFTLTEYLSYSTVDNQRISKVKVSTALLQLRNIGPLHSFAVESLQQIMHIM